MAADPRTPDERPLVLRARAGRIVTPTLNRGERFNPLSSAMIAAIRRISTQQ